MSTSEPQLYFESLAIEDETSEIHRAAMENDNLKILGIIESIPNSEAVHLINSKNIEGLTVLQNATKLNSTEVINEIVRILAEDDLIACIKEYSEEGETALHIAASENNPAVLHSLLKAIKQRNRRKDLFEVQNRSGDVVMEVAQQRGHTKVTKMIEYHDSILTEDPVSFFIKFENSIFSHTLTLERIKVRYERIEDHEEGDLGFERNINYDAAISLMHGDLTKAKDLISRAEKRCRYNIHTWCNKGMYELRIDPSNRVAAEKAAFRMLDLLTDSSGVPELRGQAFFAYWLAEVDRSAEAKEKSRELFDECHRRSIANGDDEIVEFCSYLYLKFLIRNVRLNEKRVKGEEWIWHNLETVANQLLVLWKSRVDKYHGDMWLWLAEVLLSKLPEDLKAKFLDMFTRESEDKAAAARLLSDMDPKMCLERAYNMREKKEVDIKFKARIAYNYLHFAYDCRDSATRSDWLRRARTLSEEWMREHHWTLLCASTCAYACIHLWAIEFYNHQRSFVNERYELFSSRFTIDTDHRAWKYLTEAFYSPRTPDEECTTRYLEPAKEHIARIVQRRDGWVSHGVMFAWVKSMLHDPEHEIINAFTRAGEFADTPFKKAKVCENFGHYYLVTGRRDEARAKFKEAFERCDPIDVCRLFMAKNGLRTLGPLNRNA